MENIINPIQLTEIEKDYLSLLINSQDEHILKISFHKEKLKNINSQIDKILPNKTTSKEIVEKFNNVYNISNSNIGAVTQNDNASSYTSTDCEVVTNGDKDLSIKKVKELTYN